MARRIALGLMFASLLAFGSGCVDGATPDCSDAAAGCNPDFDAYPPDTATDSAADSAADSGADSPGEASPQDTGAAEAASEGGKDAGAG